MSSVVQQDEDVQIPVPELLGALLEKGGSDLHLTAGSPPMVRVHGELEPAGEYPILTPRALQGMVYAILPQKLRERFEQELELDMSYSLPGRSRFRVNVFQQRDAVAHRLGVEVTQPRRLDDGQRLAALADLEAGGDGQALEADHRADDRWLRRGQQAGRWAQASEIEHHHRRTVDRPPKGGRRAGRLAGQDLAGRIGAAGVLKIEPGDAPKIRLVPPEALVRVKGARESAAAIDGALREERDADAFAIADDLASKALGWNPREMSRLRRAQAALRDARLRTA